MNSREALVALNLIPDVGPILVRNLLERFGNAEEVLRARRGGVKDCIPLTRQRQLLKGLKGLGSASCSKG